MEREIILMKKRIIIYLFIACISIFATACSEKAENKSSQKEEYDADEFGVLLKDTNSLFEEKSQSLNEEELSSDKGYKIYEECSKQTGLPFNKNITLHGKKASSIVGFCIESSDGNYSIPCFFGDNEANTSIFIQDGENITISGIFSEDAKSYGCLTETTIDSPKEINIPTENNIFSVVSQLSETPKQVLAVGQVEAIATIDEFKNVMNNLPIVNFDPQNYYGDNAVYLIPEDDADAMIIFTCLKDDASSIKVGDKIAVQGDAYDIMHIKNADGTITPMWGMIDIIYEFYHF